MQLKPWELEVTLDKIIGLILFSLSFSSRVTGTRAFCSILLFSGFALANDHAAASTSGRLTSVPLFEDGKTSVSFRMKDENGEVPAIHAFGIEKHLRTVELNRSPGDPSSIRVLLNGRVFPQKVSLARLSQGLNISVSVKDVREKYQGVSVKGSAYMHFRYDPESGTLTVSKCGGSLAKGLISISRELTNLTGTRE